MTRPGPRPRWVTLEGTNGVGKTHLARLLREHLDGAALLEELPDAAPDRLPGQVIAALAADSDPFLRTGHPLTETLALLALTVRRREETPAATVAVEDRGGDSVAVYQALTLAEATGADPYPLALRLLALADRWRPRADLTVLVTAEETTRCARWSARLGRPLTNTEHRRAHAVARLYEQIAADDPGRYLVLDLAQHTTEQALSTVTSAIGALTSPAGVPS
ncbi:thymidylate kinase [Streptomyces halstedii]|uniref:Thymidylate kinase n=1 Tax=Streptomyces halstedii TaxID=1944 RepID=A0ABS6U0X1_STRHA|nr:thymidylate kinase [Streptomyces halstedii]MBV7674193.1 thymidylate kinase [Streptomyces halstedii]